MSTSELSAKFNEKDTRQRIIEASIYLFGLKGYAGSSTREIAKMAGVNIASLNYHFRSKQNLLQEVTSHVIEEFKLRIQALVKEDTVNTADYAKSVYNALTEDGGLKCLNQFKLFLDAESYPGELDPYPIGFEQISVFLDRDLNKAVPVSEKLWANSIIFTYIVHMAVMSASSLGKRHMEKYLPLKRDSVPLYLEELVETVIRDLNQRYN